MELGTGCHANFIYHLSFVVGSDHPPEGLRSATLEVSGGGTLETARGVTAHQDAIVSLDGGTIMGDVTVRGAQLLLSRSSGNNSIDGFVDLSAQTTLVLDYQNKAEQVLLELPAAAWMFLSGLLSVRLLRKSKNGKHP